MALVPLSVMRSRAKAHADALGDSFLADSEWDDLLNAGLSQLHGLLVRTVEDYATSDLSFVTVTSGEVTLPTGFMKLLGVDLQVGGQWYSLAPFAWSERNSLRNMPSVDGRAARYALRGGKLVLMPAPPSGLTGSLSYTPGFTPLSGDSIPYDGVNGWEEYACLYAAAMAKVKGEEDASTLQAALAREEARVVAEAANRNPSEPGFVRDAYGDDAPPPYAWRRGA
jgi:hypothetical protein